MIEHTLASVTAPSVADTITKATGATSGRAPYELRVGPFLGSQLEVHAIAGREGISKLFRFSVEFSVDAPYALVHSLLLGQTASLAISVDGHAPRVVQGRVFACDLLGRDHPTDKLRMVAHIAPRMQSLDLNRRTRIFQDKTARDIITGLLEAAWIPYRFQLVRSLRPRPYVVQYRESDLDFILRLLREEGIYFYFEQPSGFLDALSSGALAPLAALAVTGATIFGPATAVGGAMSDAASLFDKLGLLERVVFADGNDYPGVGESYIPTGLEHVLGSLDTFDSAFLSATGTFHAPSVLPTPAVRFRPERGLIPSEEFIDTLESYRKFGAKSASLSAWSPRSQVALTGSYRERPLTVDAKVLASLVGGGELTVSATLETDALALTHAPSDYDINEHGPQQVVEAPNEQTKRNLAGLRAKLRQVRGTSGVRRLSAGHMFAVIEHPISEMNGRWVVDTVEHEGACLGLDGDPSRIYRNRFSALPARVAARPKPARPLQLLGNEIALVVGGPDGHAHCDEHGRVRIRFGWEADDSHGTAWVPVSQAWRGQDYGVWHVPRPGSSVLVGFCFGSPEHPVVLTCVPTPQTPLHCPLPEGARRWSVRSRLTDTVGHELYLDNRSGEAELCVRSAGDLQVDVLGRAVVRVGRERNSDTSADATIDTLQVRGTYEQVVERSDSLQIEGAYRANVGGDRSVSIAGEYRVRISGDAVTTVRESYTESVGLHAARNVGTHAAERVDGNVRSTVQGASRLCVSGGRTLAALGSVSESAKNLLRGASDTVDLAAIGSLRLECGTSVLEVSDAGIRLVADSILVGDPELTEALTARCEESYLCMADAEMALTGRDTLSVNAEGGVALGSGAATATLDGGGVTLSAANVCLQGGKGVLALGATAELKGDTVDLDGASAGTTSTPQDPSLADIETQEVAIGLVDQLGVAVPGAAYLLSVGEQIYEGVLDAAGRAVRYVVPGDATVRFPGYDAASWSTGAPEAAIDPGWSETASVVAVGPETPIPIYPQGDVFEGYDAVLGEKLARGIIDTIKKGWVPKGDRQLKPLPVRLWSFSGLCASGINRTVPPLLGPIALKEGETNHGVDWARIGAQYKELKKLDLQAIDVAKRWKELPAGCILSWKAKPNPKKPNRYGHVAIVTCVPKSYATDVDAKRAKDVNFDPSGVHVQASDCVYPYSILFSGRGTEPSLKAEKSRYGELLAVYMPYAGK